MAGKEEVKVNIPEAPALLPDALKKKWQAAYAGAYKELSGDNSVDETTRVQSALKEANRLLRVDAPESYEEAKALEDWQVVSRVEKGGKLRGVTIDGKKFAFDIPVKAAASTRGK